MTLGHLGHRGSQIPGNQGLTVDEEYVLCCFPHCILRIQAHAHSLTLRHTHIHTHTHSHIYTHTHSHTHTYTHIHAHRPSHPHSLLNTQPEHPGAAQPPWLCRTRLEQVICSMVQNCPTYSVPAKVKSRAKEMVQTGKTYRTEQDPLTHIPGQ